MGRRELPLHQPAGTLGGAMTAGNDGRIGAAVTRPRDAYRDVPILARPTWGRLISAYFFCGGVSSGAFSLGSLAMAGGARWRPFTRTAHVVSLIALLPCPVLLIADLGRPARFHHMLRLFKPSSPMNLGAWTLTAHGGFTTITVLAGLAHGRKAPAAGPLMGMLALGGLPTALGLGGYTGVLLGTTSVPVWSTSPLLGALFMASSLSTGLAAATAVMATRDSSEQETARTLGALGLTFGAAELTLLGGYLVSSGRAVRPLLRGRDGLLLTAAVTALSLSTTFDLIQSRHVGAGRVRRLLAPAAGLVGGALLRAAVVGAGRASSADREGTLHAMRGRDGRGWGAGG
jgi:formate-dependent nitrite reductase membrane component NrfD